LAVGAREIVALSHRARSMPIDVPVDQRDWRLGNPAGRVKRFRIAGAKLLQRKVRLVLPRQQRVANSSFGERGGGLPEPPLEKWTATSCPAFAPQVMRQPVN
jgi:hypothetical protein